MIVSPFPRPTLIDASGVRRLFFQVIYDFSIPSVLSPGTNSFWTVWLASVKGQKNKAAQQQEHLKKVLEQIKAAMEYVSGLTEEKLAELKDPLVWKNYEQLNYVFAMNDLF